MATTTTTTTLPTIPLTDIESHKSAKSCYVIMGKRVYDITDFLDDHPGGPELILNHAATDITAIMKDEVSHEHTPTAYEILNECCVGYVATAPVLDAATQSARPAGIVPLPPATGAGAREIAQAEDKVYAATGLSCAEDLSRDTDLDQDFKTHHFLDLNRPLLMQVWRGGFSKEFYLEQVHRPRHYRGGASAPLFGNFLEPLSLTAWWVVPSVWLPAIAYTLWVARAGLESGMQQAAYFLGGLCIWTLVEYGLHRCLFHLDDYLPDNRVGITLHFLMHGIHHYLPMDKYRLVMPPTLLVVLATPFWYLAHAVFFHNWYAATTVFAGGILGYVCYDLTHYFLHHRNLPSYYRELKKYHLAHHFADYQNGFGVSSRFWDRVFGTELVYPAPKVIKTS